MFSSYDKFTGNFKKVIQRSAWICLNELKRMITPKHLLMGIFFVPESKAYALLKHAGISTSSLEKTSLFKNKKNFSHINPNIDYNEVFSLAMSNEAVRILERGADIALHAGAELVGTEHLLAALLEFKNELFMQELHKIGVDMNRLEELTKNALGIPPLERGRSGHPPLPPPPPLPRLSPPAHGVPQPQTQTHVIEKTLRRDALIPTPALDYFTIDLTSKKKQKDLMPIVGRKKELERLIHILSRRNKNNPLLLGEPGVGKTAIVEGLAKRIYEEAVPDILANKRILNLDLNAVVAGTIYRGEFEQRLKQIIDEAKSQDDIILFIDEIHNLIGAGSAAGSLDAANIFKPSLARGEVSCIGATTLQEYKAHFENDAALDRRFQTIMVDEPTPRETLKILEGIKGNIETYHRVTITDDALEEAVSLADRFFPNRFFPDKAIDLVDEAASRIKVLHTKDEHGKTIRGIKDKLKDLMVRKENAVKHEDFSKAITFKNSEESLLKKLFDAKKMQKATQKIMVGAITKEHIAEVVTDMVQIPFLEMANLNAKRLLDLEHILGTRVLGQKKVLKEVSRTLRRSEAGLSDPKRPLASFVFLGPSGVGKTETAKAIAEEVFGEKNALIRINMSEFHDSYNVSKLIGAPAGYVGYKEGNQLADKVRARPYSVVLFDEMEKAHPDVFDLLLQVLEDGYLMESTGKQVNFKNTVIIFTSNIGLERFNQHQELGFRSESKNIQKELQGQFDALRENILEELHSNFKVEFLNRLDKILVFEPLTENVVHSIVEMNINALNEKLSARSISVTLSPATKKWLATESFSPDDGARSVRRVIQEQLEELLVEKILRGEVNHGDAVKVGMKGKRLTISK